MDVRALLTVVIVAERFIAGRHPSADHRDRARTARGIDPSPRRVERQVVDISGNGHAGDDLTGVAVHDNQRRVRPAADEEPVVGLVDRDRGVGPGRRDGEPADHLDPSPCRSRRPAPSLALTIHPRSATFEFEGPQILREGDRAANGVVPGVDDGQLGVGVDDVDPLGPRVVSHVIGIDLPAGRS